MIQTVSMHLTILHSNNLSKRSDALIIKWLNLYKASSVKTFTQMDAKIQIQKSANEELQAQTAQAVSKGSGRAARVHSFNR